MGLQKTNFPNNYPIKVHKTPLRVTGSHQGVHGPLQKRKTYDKFEDFIVIVIPTQWGASRGWVLVSCIEFQFIGDRDPEGSFLVRERHG